MADKWFRFYSDTLNDPVVQTLDPDTFKAWVNLLCLANESPERGFLPSNKDIAWNLRIPLQSAIEVVEHLTQQGLLVKTSDNRLTLRDWSLNRGPIDPTGAERTRRCRARRKANGE